MINFISSEQLKTLYKEEREQEEVDEIKVMIYGNENPGEFYVLKWLNIGRCKRICSSYPVVFDNLTGRLAKRKRKFCNS